MRAQFKATLCLLMTAIIWGLSFVAQRTGAGYMGTFWFSTFRSIIGSAVLVLIYAICRARAKAKGKEPAENEKVDVKLLVKAGLICGVLIFLAMNMQQEGLATVDAGKASFLTALYIILVPIMGIFVKQKTNLLVWISAVIALVGIYLLSIKKGDFSIQWGDLIVLIGSIFWGLHILAVNVYAPKMSVMLLTAAQFFVAGVLSLIVALFTEDITWYAVTHAAVGYLYTGIMSTSIAFTLQALGQRNAGPTVTAMVLSTEAIWATLFGFLILGEMFTMRELTGSILMFAAIILSQLPVDKLRKRKELS